MGLVVIMACLACVLLASCVALLLLRCLIMVWQQLLVVSLVR
jgi:hypothetical protein